MSEARWRVGKNVPINVYEGERPICQCHTAIDAKRIVEAMNRESSFKEDARFRGDLERKREAGQ